MSEKQPVHVPRIPNSTIAQTPARRGAGRRLARALAIGAAMIIGGGAGAMIALGGVPGIQQAFLGKIVEPPKTEAVAQVDELRYDMYELRAHMNAAVDQMTVLRTALTTTNQDNAARFSALADAIEHATATAAPSAATVAADAAPAAPVVTTGRGAAAEITGSVPKSVTPVAAPATRKKQKPLAGWTVRNVTDGVAQIESAAGRFEAEPGKSIPGLGRVHEIKFRDGRWIVVTQRGPIVTFR